MGAVVAGVADEASDHLWDPIGIAQGAKIDRVEKLDSSGDAGIEDLENLSDLGPQVDGHPGDVESSDLHFGYDEEVVDYVGHIGTLGDQQLKELATLRCAQKMAGARSVSPKPTTAVSAGRNSSRRLWWSCGWCIRIGVRNVRPGNWSSVRSSKWPHRLRPSTGA